MILLRAQKNLRTRHSVFHLNVDLHVATGEHTGIVGVSGAGKTTLLRVLAGLETPDDGKIIVDEKTWFDSQQNINIPPQNRSIGYVFQNYALFPNMTAQENLEFAFSSAINHTRLRDIMEMLAITDIAHQLPHTLSGGQKQRVALGRALMRDPKVLLLDEPLSSLDPAMRQTLQNNLALISRHFEGTIILVSHDMREIIQLTRTAVILDQGKIIQRGAPAELLSFYSDDIGEVEIVGLVPKKYMAIVKSDHGILHVHYDKDAANKPQIGDKIRLTI